MEQYFKNMLKSFNIEEQEEIQKAIQCQKSQEKWLSFMENYIQIDQRDKFLEQLEKLHILKRGSIDVVQNQTRNILAIYYELWEHKFQIQLIDYPNKIQEYKWSDDLMNQIRISMKKSIQVNLKNSKLFGQFLNEQKDQIFDILARRCSLRQYFDQVKLVNQTLRVNNHLENIIKWMNFGDFIILIIKYADQKDIIGSLLNQQGIPVPILIQTPEFSHLESQVARKMFDFQEFSLILNIGTPKTAKCGKTTLINKLMSIDEKLRYDPNFTSVLTLTKKINFSKQKNVMLADFNGCFQPRMSHQIFKKMLILAKSTSLLILHVNEEEIMEKQLLFSSEYQRLFEGAEKILIFVRDSVRYLKGKLITALPEQIKHKTLLQCLKKMAQNQIQTEYKRIIEQISQKQFNKFISSKFSFINLCQKQEQQKLKDVTNKIELIVEHKLSSESYQKEKILPYLINKQRICEIQMLIKREDQNFDKISPLLSEKIRLNNERELLPLSYFMKSITQILSRNMSYIDLLIEKISKWKNSRQQPLRRQFLKLTDSLNNIRHQDADYKDKQRLIRKKILQNQQKRNNFEVSIDKFISELILLNKTRFNSDISELIQNYYKHSAQNLYPISIIDGKTLEFGNDSLQKYLSNLSKIYQNKNKKVYIVSVIGAQSSAKSTLLNYLFRCRFETSEGRCTKGVYMTLCQCEDQVIVVLDTQGLLSVSDRDTAFDHQIATFVLKISNLVIINNKGELTKNLTHMLEVCLYVLQCLHKNQQKTQFQPKKILFAIRDQCKPQGKFQQQMAGKIKNALYEMKQNSCLNYQDYISITAEDILCFPNAFEQRRGLIPNSSIYLYSQNFGKCIAGMRKKIIDTLKTTKPLSFLDQFYEQSARVWHTVQTCGKQIMNYKTINEILIRQGIQRKFQEKRQEYRDFVHQKYAQLFEKIRQGKDLLQLTEYQEQLEAIRLSTSENLKIYFSEQCKTSLGCLNHEWIKHFDRNIEDMCRIQFNNYKYKLLHFKKMIVLKNSSEEYENSIGEYFKLFLNQNDSRNTDQIIKRFNSCADQKLLEKKSQIQRENKQKSLSQIMKTLEYVFYSNQRQFKINYLQDCVETYDNFKKFLDRKLFVKMSKEIFISDNTFYQIKQIINSITNKFKLQIQNTFQPQKKSFMSNIKQHIMPLIEIINDFQHICDRQISQYSSKWWFASVVLNKMKYRMVLFGYLYKFISNQAPKLVQEQLRILCLEYEQITLKYKHKLNQILKLSGDIKKTINYQIESFPKEFSNKVVKKCKQIIEEKMEIIAHRLNPQGIFLKAMAKTFANQSYTNVKQYLIDCFKIVKNINRFLFDYMCQEQYIENKLIVISRSKTEAVSLLMSEVKQILKKINEFLITEENEAQMTKMLEKYNLHAIVQLISRNPQKKMQILSQFHRKLLSSECNIEIQCLRLLQQKDFFIAFINNFIKFDLRNKVIGCQQCCPSCNMKCMKEAGHAQCHKIANQCHVIEGFGGSHYFKSNEPSLKICLTEEAMVHSWKVADVLYKNCKEYIDKCQPRWKDQFPAIGENYCYQSNATIAKYLEIWANLEDVLIATKCREMKKSTNPFVVEKQREGNCLAMEDLQREFIDPFTNNRYKLKDY